MNPFTGSKLLGHLDRVAAWQRGEVVPPVTVELDLTGRCNHRCPACAGGYRGGDMPTELAADVLRQLAGYGVRGVIFTGGGEPLLHPEAPSLIAMAHGLGLSVGLITNGTTLTEDDAAWIVPHCQWVRVSIDAGTAAQHLTTHGVDGFIAAWESVAMLAEAKRDAGSACTIGVGYLVGEENISGMLSATAIARAIGADYLQFRPFHGRPLPVGAMVAGCRAIAGDHLSIVSSDGKYARIGQARGYTACHGAAFTGTIQADGRVVVCCHLRGRAEMVLGDLHHETFRAIWESDRKRRIVGAIDVGDCLPLCRSDGLNCWLESARTPADHPDFL